MHRVPLFLQKRRASLKGRLVGRDFPPDYVSLRSAPHFAQVRDGQNVTNGPFVSNTDVPHTGHLNFVRNHMLAGMRNTNASTPNKIVNCLLEVENAAIIKPTAARNAAVTDNRARILRVISGPFRPSVHVRSIMHAFASH